LGQVPGPLLEQLRSALPRVEVSREPALTTPPWESALLELKFQDGQRVFVQRVRDDVLRVDDARWCGSGERGDELRLVDGPSLLPWFMLKLGPTRSKEYLLPPP
jgi:hypothetical protein